MDPFPLQFNLYLQLIIQLKGKASSEIYPMLNFIKSNFSFCNSLSKYKEILSPHIYKVLNEDEKRQKMRYNNCKKYFDDALKQYTEDQLKNKCSMIFSANCISNSLDEQKAILSSLILKDQIKTQYQLDQIVKWLLKQIKINKSIGEKDILLKLQGRISELQTFQKELNQIAETDSQVQKQIDPNSLCKQFRQKFFTIDSKVIYNKVAEFFEKHTNCIKKSTCKKENKFWDKIENIKPRIIKEECNEKQTYEQHLKITQGKIRFRFPPEPNGYLHIGHVKSIRINFETAKQLGGLCFLRYDDTNPDTQTHEFIQEIQENVKWLGYTPDKITFASDYFQQMIYYANELIKKDKAYVCDCSQEVIELQRKLKHVNPCRNRKIEQNLKIFPNLMSFQTLRLKGDPSSTNPTLRDPIIFRNKQKVHPKTGSKFKIYPIYDFAHCISDSIEHIDYSLCSLQFEIRRQLYYHILHELQIFKPNVWEYSRLNIEGNFLSKRKIKDLIEKQIVQNWDDPRLLTIRGLRNRGYTADMLKEFVDKVNSSRAGNQNVVQFSLLEREMKKKLIRIAPRTMGVLDPFQVSLVSEQNIIQEMEVDLFSEEIHHKQQKSIKAKRKIVLTNNIWIQREDAIKLEKDSLFILKYAGVCKVIRKDGQKIEAIRLRNEKASEVHKKDNEIKILHWISEADCKTMKINVYGKLLNENKEINESSKKIYSCAKIAKTMMPNSEIEYWQLERIGFCKFSDKDELILCSKL